MCFRNCWYAAIFESHADNPKLKTGDTVSRFELNSTVKQLSKGESLLVNKKIYQAVIILSQKTQIYGQMWVRCFKHFSVFCS